MNIATFKRESALNRQAFQQLRVGIRQNYKGQYVAMANAKIVGAPRRLSMPPARSGGIAPVSAGVLPCVPREKRRTDSSIFLRFGRSV